MTKTTMKSSEPRARWVLVDTNVLVYPWDPRDIAKGAKARDVYAALSREGVLVHSTQTLGEFFRVVTRRIPRVIAPERAARVVVKLAEAQPVLPVTVDVTLTALVGSLRYGFSYWDAQLWATAKANGVRVILTEDFEDGREVEGVRFADPFVPGFDVSALVASLVK